jgi:hypothetical protein
MPYLDYGSCDGCPSYSYPNWTPTDYGWTLDQVYDMVANGSFGIANPQIYRTDGLFAEEWYYLSLYEYVNNFSEPIPFMGSLTEWDACLEVDSCQSGTSDAINNEPEEGWKQLWGRISSDRRTSTSKDGITIFDLPISTDISWSPLKVSVSR